MIQSGELRCKNKVTEHMYHYRPEGIRRYQTCNHKEEHKELQNKLADSRMRFSMDPYYRE